MVTFRCKRSGNTVSFTSPEDIAGLRKHESYEEVIEKPKEAEVQTEVKVPKQRGRPKQAR